MTTGMRKVLAGIGGWEHGALDGLLYGARETATQEKLVQYARFFDAVEVRSTFWDDALGASEAASWLRAVRDNKRFVFGVKLHRSFTHGRIYTAESARTIRGLLQELARADRLAACVMQFPAAFTNTGAHRHHLTKLAGLFAGFPLAAEFRHTSWHHPSMTALLEELGVAAVQADFPRLGHLMPFHTALVGRTAYLRLHGRNERGWLQNGMDTRYDYLYNGREVREIERRLEHLEGKCDRAVVIWNNTTGGKALANAFQLQAALHGDQVPVPERTLAAFPHLRSVGIPAEECEPLFAAEAYRRVS